MAGYGGWENASGSRLINGKNFEKMHQQKLDALKF